VKQKKRSRATDVQLDDVLRLAKKTDPAGRPPHELPELTWIDRKEIATLLWSLVPEPKAPSHRKRKNADRDIFVTIDFLLSDENSKQKRIAPRWRMKTTQVGNIVFRMRDSCEKLIAERPDPEFWKPLIETYRERHIRTAKGSDR
jgi:hypothetical protein